MIELLNLAGMPTGFGQTRSTSQRGVYRMVFRARDEQVARVALAEGHRLLMAAINDEPFDVAGRRGARAQPRSTTATSARAPPASSPPRPTAAFRTSA